MPSYFLFFDCLLTAFMLSVLTDARYYYVNDLNVIIIFQVDNLDSLRAESASVASLSIHCMMKSANKPHSKNNDRTTILRTSLKNSSIFLDIP